MLVVVSEQQGGVAQSHDGAAAHGVAADDVGTDAPQHGAKAFHDVGQQRKLAKAVDALFLHSGVGTRDSGHGDLRERVEDLVVSVPVSDDLQRGRQDMEGAERNGDGRATNT